MSQRVESPGPQQGPGPLELPSRTRQLDPDPPQHRCGAPRVAPRTGSEDGLFG